MTSSVPEQAETSRVAIVTGAAQGIGLGIARRLGHAGHAVAMIDRDVGGLDAAVAELRAAGIRCAPFGADVTIESDVSAAIAAVTAWAGAPAILVNNAGISPSHGGTALPLEDTPLHEWNLVLAVNLTGAFLMCRAALPGMRALGWGRIINISSMGGRMRSLLSGPHYAATKAGIIGFTRVLAGQAGPDGITANCVAPGRVVTPQSESFGGAEEFVRQLPMRRLGTPADIADAVAYLCSEAAGYVTGTVLDVNGGHFMP